MKRHSRLSDSPLTSPQISLTGRRQAKLKVSSNAAAPENDIDDDDLRREGHRPAKKRKRRSEDTNQNGDVSKAVEDAPQAVDEQGELPMLSTNNQAAYISRETNYHNLNLNSPPSSRSHAL